MSGSGDEDDSGAGGAARRGRPRGFDRDRALAVAVRMFWERGYEGASVGELTRAMGIRPPSLYAAFGDKRSLFEEAVRAYGRTEHGAAMGRAFHPDGPARAAFADMLAALARVYPGTAEHPPGCLVICAAANVPPRDEEVRDFLRGLRNANLQGWTARLDAAVASGELPPTTDTSALAGYFAAVVQGMSQRAWDGADEAELATTADLAMRAWPGTAG